MRCRPEHAPFTLRFSCRLILFLCMQLLSLSYVQAQLLPAPDVLLNSDTQNKVLHERLSQQDALAPVPLDGQAWRLTEQAFDSFKKDQFADATQQVSLALLLRPDVEQLWLLKIYALQNQGLLRDALHSTQQAYQQGIRSQTLTALLTTLSEAVSQGLTPRYTGNIGTAQSISHIATLTPLTLAARVPEPVDPYWQLTNEAYSSFKINDFTKAIQLATRAIALNPKDLNIRLLLVYALQKQGKVQQANQAVQEALRNGLDSQALRQVQRSLLPPPLERTPDGAPMTLAYKKGFQIASKAFAEFKSGQFEQAARHAQQAFSLYPSEQQWALLWIDALQAQGQYQQAQAAIKQALLNIPSSQALLSRKQSLIQQLADQYAQAGYAAIDSKQPAQAAAFATKAIELSAQTPSYWLLLIEALKLDHQPEAALAATSQAIARNTGDSAPFLMQRGYLNQSLGHKQQALEDFEAARATGHAPSSSILDLAYAQANTGQKLAAVDSFKQAIDLADQSDLSLTPEQRFTTRNSIANLSREWGAYISGSYRGARPATSGIGGAAITVPGNSVFSTAELFWRPPSFLNTSTQTFEIYGRLSNTLYDGGSQTASQSVANPCGTGAINVGDQSNHGAAGLPTSLGALGLRLTPSTDIGVTIGVERQFMLGSATRTGYVIPESEAARCALNTNNQNSQYQTGAGNGGWMTYLTYGLYEGTELRMGKPDWFTLETYAQTGYSWQDMPTQLTLNDNSSGQTVQTDSGRLKRNQAFAAGEFRIGRSFRMDQVSDHLVLFPYLVIGGDWLSINNQVTGLTPASQGIEMQGNGSTWSMGVGPGLNIRYWFREDRYNGPQSYLNTTIQYRFNVGGGQADRAKGLFINMTLSY